MNYKANEIEIPQDDPFKHDKLNREEEVSNISVLLENISSPIVISVNAPWGTGKSTFLKMLHKHLLNKNNRAIYFSAWETDFADDPLLAFLGEINETLKKDIEGPKAETWNKVKVAGSKIIKRGIPVALKLLTMGILDLNEITEKEISELMESYSKNYIEEYEKSKSAIKVFRDNISEIISNSENDKLYIIIDELDRCRPTYAIELLERIKHLFNVKGIVFVLALDRDQLAHSIKGIYGNDFGAKGYLKRFIDIEYSLNEIEEGAYIDYLFDHFGIDDFYDQEHRRKHSALNGEGTNLRETLKVLILNTPASLRDIEQLIAKINLVLLSTRENEFTYPPLLAMLLVAKEYYPKIYSEFIKEGSSAEPMCKLLNEIIPKEQRLSSYHCALIEGFVISSKMSQEHSRAGQKMINLHEKRLDDQTLDKSEIDYSMKVINIAKQPTKSISGPVRLNSLVQRIEMSKQFNFMISDTNNE